MKKLKLSSKLCMLCCAVLGVFLFAKPALADSGDGLVVKAALSGLYSCYQAGAYKTPLELTKYTGASSLISKKNATKIYLPTGLADASALNCSTVLSGASKFTGLYSIGGVTPPKTTGDVPSFLTSMGYTKTGSTGQRCLSVTYNGTSTSSNINYQYINKIYVCADVSNGKIQSKKMEVKYQTSTTTPEGTIGKSNNKVGSSIKVGTQNNQITCYRHNLTGSGWSTIDKVKFNVGDDWSSFVSNFKSQGCAPDSLKISSNNWTYTRSGSVGETNSGEIDATYEITDKIAAANKAISTLSKYSNFDSLALDAIEKRTLLNYYLTDYYGMTTLCGNNVDVDQAKGDKYIGPYNIALSDGSIQKCYVKATKNDKQKVQVWDPGNNHLGVDQQKTFEEVVAMYATQSSVLKEEQKQACNDAAESSRRAAQALLNQSTTSEEYRKKAKAVIESLDKILSDHGEYWYEENDTIVCYPYTDINGAVTTPNMPEVTTDPGGNGNNNNNNGSADDIDDCTGVAGSLGWILCPVLKIVSEGVDDIYDSYVQEQFLEIDPTKVTVNGSIYKSWAVIRNVANIIFVILFLIVLLSQLTGIGLTNYSIKKMLPRLIVIAVVVNVSFLVCQFAVDVSNVLGYGLNALFDGMSSTAGLTGSLNQATSATTGGVATWVEILGVAIAASTIGSWLIPLLLTLLSCAISVFFGAIILAARQAAVYILIVLAPAAIVCYALPNAKRAIFDRWLKIFTSMLMVFPICGALVGGGFFASNILLSASSGGFFLTLVAMLLRVAPFFLIPSLVRGSMTALGNAGARISNLGNRLGGFTTGTIRKSDAYQRAAELGEQARGRGIALRHRILSGITGGRYTGSRGSKRRLARAVGLQESRLRGDAKAGAIAAGGFLTRGQASDIMAAATASEEDQGIKDAEAGFKLDPDLDTGDHTAVNNQLVEHLNALQANPTSVEARRRVKALMKILLESDDGRGDLFNTVRDFTEANRDSDVTKILGKYLGSDENMAKIKANNQRGLQNLVQDINRGNSIRSALDYGALGTDKISAGAVGGMDTSALASQVAAATGGTLTGTSLQQLADVYTKALTSENAAKEIKPEMVANLNEIRRQAYMANNGGSDAGFKALNPGDILKVRRTAAPVPAGWTASGVWVGGGNGPTLQQQVAYNEWAKHKAEVDRHNSQL